MIFKKLCCENVSLKISALVRIIPNTTRTRFLISCGGFLHEARKPTNNDEKNKSLSVPYSRNTQPVNSAEQVKSQEFSRKQSLHFIFLHFHQLLKHFLFLFNKFYHF